LICKFPYVILLWSLYPLSLNLSALHPFTRTLLMSCCSTSSFLHILIHTLFLCLAALPHPFFISLFTHCSHVLLLSLILSSYPLIMTDDEWHTCCSPLSFCILFHVIKSSNLPLIFTVSFRTYFHSFLHLSYSTYFHSFLHLQYQVLVSLL